MRLLLMRYNDRATTKIYIRSLHDALPISGGVPGAVRVGRAGVAFGDDPGVQQRGLRLPAGEAEAGNVDEHQVVVGAAGDQPRRSEEHTSELQSRQYIACRLLLEKKKSH